MSTSNVNYSNLDSRYAKPTDVDVKIAAQAAVDSGQYVTQVSAPTLIGQHAPSQTGIEKLRAAVRAGAITASAPLVAIGDSHTDATTSAQYLWQRLQTVDNQPGGGLDDVAASAIIPLGNSGQRLTDYLNNNTASNKLPAALALNPFAIIACWLTNDVRLGGLGLTVPAIRTSGSALLAQLIATIKSTNPGTTIILRIPFPYTTIDDGSHYITDGTNINPAGLAQIYTDGVRLAHYDVQLQYPDVILYDPQTRCAGTTSPTANTGYYANQIHQTQAGYYAEADDFASFIGAQAPYQAAASAAAQAAAPATPWIQYYRDPEDASRYVKVFEGLSSALTAGQTYADMDSAIPAVSTAGNITARDIIVFYGARTALMIPTGVTITKTSTTSLRISSLGSVPAVANRTRVAIYRRITGTDTTVNAVMNDTSYRYKRFGRVSSGGNTTFVDLSGASFGGTISPLTGADYATTVQAGDKVYIEGNGLNPITLTSSNFSVSGANLRITGLSGFDYSTVSGNVYVIVGSHSDVAAPLSTKTTSYTLTAYDGLVIFNGSSLTATLPDPTTVATSLRLTIKNVNATALTVASAGSAKTVDGATSQSLAQWAHSVYASDGTQWLQIA